MSQLHRRSLRYASLVFALSLVTTAGCASGGSGGQASSGSNRDLITSEELRALAPMNAYQAVQRLRGRWLQNRRAGPPAVHVDGRFTGRIEVLQQYEIEEVQQLQFRSAANATTLYGTNYPSGVVEITTRR